MTTPGASQPADPARRQVGESHKEYADRVYGMYRAALVDAERLDRVRRLMDRLVTDPDGGVQNVRVQVLALTDPGR